MAHTCPVATIARTKNCTGAVCADGTNMCVVLYDNIGLSSFRNVLPELVACGVPLSIEGYPGWGRFASASQARNVNARAGCSA